MSKIPNQRAIGKLLDFYPIPQVFLQLQQSHDRKSSLNVYLSEAIFTLPGLGLEYKEWVQ